MLEIGLVLIVAAAFLAFANGANDNFKGVATLYGSGTSTYRGALVWATITTFAGSLAAVFLAGQLIKAFSGKGLVPDSLTADPQYLSAVALGAVATVLFATIIGMPISTTHSLVGGLVGAGLAAGSGLNGTALATTYLGPLLVSPLLALVLTVLLHRTFRRARLAMGVVDQSCFCVGAEAEPVSVVTGMSGELALREAQQMTVSLGTEVSCKRRYGGAVAGIKAQSLLDGLHYLSAGIVSFARGLNDTPKIAALMLAGVGLSGLGSAAVVGLGMAFGGLLAARRVAETMSHKITPMNSGQGFSANLVTGLVVIGASRLGVPVSTTHVSCGGIFGVGAVTAEAKWPMIGRIVGAWVLTLPLAAALAAAGYVALGRL